MKAGYFSGSRHKAIFRKEVDYDLSNTRRLWFDIYCPESNLALRFALAFRSASGSIFRNGSHPVVSWMGPEHGTGSWREGDEYRHGSTGLAGDARNTSHGS